MKKLSLYFLISILGSTSTLFAQLSEEVRSMSQGASAALVLDIPGTEAKLVGNVWKDYVKDFYDAKPKYDRKTDEWITAGAEIAALGRGKPVDLYTAIKEYKTGTEVSLWIDLGEGFLSSAGQPERFAEAEKFMMRFGLEVARATTQIQLDEQEKALRDLNRELERLLRDNEKYHSNIKSQEEKIREAEKALAKNEKDIKQMGPQLEGQEEAISLAAEAKNLELMEQEEDNLKDLKKAQRKLKNEKSRNQDIIESSKNRIRKLEKDIIENLRDQEAKRAEIQTQETVVEAIREKLNGL